MDKLLTQFGHAVDNEIITITISPPKNRVAVLKITHNILKEHKTYSIPIFDQIRWYEIALELGKDNWL